MTNSEKGAFQYCQVLAQSHYENFPVASRFISAKKRKYVWALYAFARTADDFADEISDPQESLKRLADWDEKLDAAIEGTPDHPIFIAIKKTIEDCHIPPSLLHDLVSAFRMDVTKNRHESFEELLNYCRYSANPIGRLFLLIHGFSEEQQFMWSDKICSALQLTNFWQDVTRDLLKDRVYIPKEFMNQYQYTEIDLFNKIYNPNFATMMKELVERTEELFYEGLPLIPSLDKKLQFEIKLTWHGGMHILNKIKQLHYNVLKERPKLKFKDKIVLLSKAMRKKLPSPIIKEDQYVGSKT